MVRIKKDAKVSSQLVHGAIALCIIDEALTIISRGSYRHGHQKHIIWCYGDDGGECRLTSCSKVSSVVWRSDDCEHMIHIIQ